MRKLTTFFLTLLLITLGASAQTDFTWKFNIDTWTRDAGNTSAGWYGEYEDGAKERYGDEIAVSGDPVKVLYQTVTGLPAGEYTLTFNAVANNAWVGAAVGNNIAQVFVTANGATQTKDVTVYDQTGCTPSDYPHTFTVTVGADGTLEYGLQNIATGGNWYIAQGVSLTYSGDYTPAEGDQVYGCTTMFSHWGITGNTGEEAFQLNTWSTATGMSKPTCEYWVFNTSNLTAATLSHEALTGLQAGTYEVSIAASATAENASGTVGEGTTFNANGESVDLTTGTYSVPTGMGGNYCGTYTVEATVDDAGTLDISFTIPSGVTYNWLQFQDLSVTLKELAAEEEEPEPEPEDDGAYKFVCTDWVTLDVGRVTQDKFSYDEDANTITVEASGTNNVALGNSLTATYLLPYDGVTTANYIVTNEQKWFTIVGTNLSTTASDSKLWWMNAANYGEWDAQKVVELSDGQILVAWDLTETSINTNLQDEENYLNGWTGAGLTSTTGTSVISDINFYTDEELEAIIGSDEEPGTFEPTTVSYTDYLHVELGSEDEVMKATVDVEYTAADVINFTLYNLAVAGTNVGNVKVTGITLEDGEDGVCTFSYSGNDVTVSGGVFDDLIRLVSITIDISGDITEEKLHANMTVDVTMGSSSLLSITADFGYSEAPEPEPATLAAGEYLIVNAEGNYLGGGLTWGTQAAIIGKPQFIGFELQEDGTYHLDSHQYNNASAHYLGANLYFDNATPVDWTIAEVEGGYTISGTVEDTYDANGNVTSYKTGYLTSNGFQTVPTVEETPYVWTLVTMDDVVASMADASGEAPVDATALIAAPELKRNSNTSYYPTWTVTGFDGTGTPSNYAFGGGSAVANCAESYHSTNGFNFSQEVTLPKSGTYKLSAKGFYRDDNSTTLLLPVMYVDDQSVEFPEITRTDEYLGVADNMANAYQEFLLGKHEIEAITFTTYRDDKTVTIGFKGEDTSLWNIMGELELLYCGEEEATPEDVYVPVHECEAEESHWTTDGTTGIAYNTWSVEEDPSGMVAPFLQLWVWGLDATQPSLEAATVSHETLTDLEPGSYEVSLDIRIYSEVGNEIGEGTTFNANGVSADLMLEGNEATNSTDDYEHETLVYGTYVLTCTVGEAGTLDISINIPEGVDYNWISWKNLKVAEKVSTADIELTAVEGTMNAEIEETQLDAVAKFDKTRTAESYYEAIAAIEAAEASVAYYAPIEAAVDALDEDGAAVWAESEYAEALTNRTLTNEDVSEALAAAQIVQTTAGSDMTYVLKAMGEWKHDTASGVGNFQPCPSLPTAHEAWTGSTFGGSIDDPSLPLYKEIADLPAGEYTISFYAYARYTEKDGAVALAFANEAEQEVPSDNELVWSDATLYTFSCTVGSDGVLDFGLKSQGVGDWFVAEECSLTLVEVAEVEDLSELIAQYKADCTAAEGCEANLADMIENGDKTDETKAEMAAALEALETVMAEYGNIDTTATTAEELTEAIAAIEAALAEAQDVYATGLQTVTVATEDDAIYTLSGVRVSKAVKGVYIVNGKKVLVK